VLVGCSPASRSFVTLVRRSRMESAAYYIEKAAQCRRLAAGLNDDRAVKALWALAEKFEALAAKAAAREDGEKAE
jgi:hypothetical protein